MLSNEEFVRESLEDNLFYLRTIREFCTNIQLSFFKNNMYYINISEDFALKYEELGRRIIKYADGNLSMESLESQIFFTDYTLKCEELTEKLFNIKIDTNITKQEMNLKPGDVINPSNEMIKEIDTINKLAYNLTENFIGFCEDILEELRNQNLFSYSYLSIFEYMILESQSYLKNLERLINKYEIDPTFVSGYQYMYNKSMKDIATFIRNFVDTNSIEIINEAEQFIQDFNTLLNEYETTPLSPYNQKLLEDKSLNIVNKFRDFISRCIQKLLEKKLYFIVEPIFLDNMYTEANYFKYILEIEEKEILK